MTRGQIAQLQELSKCYMPRYSFAAAWINYMLQPFNLGDRLSKVEEGFLRKFTHQYRHQIKAMKRNRVAR